MRPRRFDTQLQFVFTALSALTLVVGLTSMGVNRHLINTHRELLGDAMPAVQLAERVGADAELAWGAADRLRAADNEEQIESAAGQLTGFIDGIEAGVGELRLRFPESGAQEEAARSRGHAARMRANALDAHSIRAALRAEAERTEAATLRLAAIVAAQNDLARLRITAGISELYTAPDAATRAGLDRLADRDFFAYERIGELSETVAELGRSLRQAAAAQTQDELDLLGSDSRAGLD
ncbi:MAG: hypothetical protein IH590_17705, partial [Aquamicrobium sp.]|nr:hypothetical protein [Aquamicrobium sp.]